MAMSANTQKIRIAVIAYAGASAGGTQKFLQTIAGNIGRDKFTVDYYYSDPAPVVIGPQFMYPGTSLERLKYLDMHGVNLIKFNVGKIDLTSPYNNWINTDFWEKFDESKYDIIQTGRAGHKEYPFTHIRNTPIIDSVHLTAGADNQFNIARVMHITNWSADKWIASGGDKNRVEIISHPIEIKSQLNTNLRHELGIPDSNFVYGFHQRVSDDIFSDMPLSAYKQIETEQTHFVIMGGGNSYKTQALKLCIKNILFVDHCADPERIYSFLRTLNVYAHGRKDGEVNSTAMAEAMYFGLPIISHTSLINNGHIECIADAGLVVTNIDEYVAELIKIKDNTNYFTQVSQSSKRRFMEMYDLQTQINRIESIYVSVYTDPFPNRLRRYLTSLHWTQNIRNWLKYLYRKYNYHFRSDKIGKL